MTTKTLVPFTLTPIGGQCTVDGMCVTLLDGRSVFVGLIDGHKEGPGVEIEFQRDISDTERSQLKFQLSLESATVMAAMLLATGAVGVDEVRTLAIAMIKKKNSEAAKKASKEAKEKR